MADETIPPDGLVKVKPELIIPDEVSTIAIKQEEDLEIDCGLSEENVSIKKEVADEVEATYGLVLVKEETHGNYEEEVVIISDDDSNPASSLRQSGDSSRDMDFLKDVQDLKSEDMSSDVDVQSNSSKKENKLEKGAVRMNCFHTDKKSYQCLQCNHKFKRQADLRRHIMARHTGEKPHQCPHCDYKSTVSHGLKRHIIVFHIGEDIRNCPHCGYESDTPHELNRHIITEHTAEKPHKCPYCEYRGFRYASIKTHIMDCHEDKKLYQCPHCDFRTSWSGNMKKHIKAWHTGEKPHH